MPVASRRVAPLSQNQNSPTRPPQERRLCEGQPSRVTATVPQTAPRAQTAALPRDRGAKLLWESGLSQETIPALQDVGLTLSFCTIQQTTKGKGAGIREESGNFAKGAAGQCPRSEQEIDYTSLVFQAAGHSASNTGDYENMKTGADYVNVDPKKRTVDFWPCLSPVASAPIEYTEVKL
ncbi:regulator of hemoglobinization and erythroid cell expansion protein isoform X1 [Pelodiscus sinensis]|uniref:regulator of hemoglobinization and erythroid cell expansion protein isoform X1 n=1 Tax=Pelodiscus sinensis TaxID=13735 RepID=UPI003F6B06B7